MARLIRNVIELAFVVSSFLFIVWVVIDTIPDLF